MSTLVDHAKRELQGIGMLESEDEMNAAAAQDILSIVEVFAGQGHSGFSASYVANALNKLLRFEPLGPLTGAESEWWALDYDEDMQAQNIRCRHVFRRSDGTAYDIQGRIFRDPDGTCVTSKDSRVDITFPYTPKSITIDRREDGTWDEST